MKIKRQKKLKKLLLVILTVITAFSTWLVISFCLVDTTLEMSNDYQLPEFTKINNLPEIQYGSNAVAIDGTIVSSDDYNSEAPKIKPTASTAKMILALAIMQKKPFKIGETGEIITIDQEMYNTYVYYLTHNGSNTKVQVGETLSEYDALMGVLLSSSNNLADNLAIWAFGSIDEYREYATNMLSKWGVINTTIGIDACGFDPSTTSTAEDLAIIGTKLMEEPVLSEIVATKEYDLPVTGMIKNTNKLLGQNNISGIKTGYIGDASGYCLVTGYKEGDSNITTALLGAPTREKSFADSLRLIAKMQELIKDTTVVEAGDLVGHYYSWWTGQINIFADEKLNLVGWNGAETSNQLIMHGANGELMITINDKEYKISVTAEPYNDTPSFGEKLSHIFGWNNQYEGKITEKTEQPEEEDEDKEENDTNVKTNATSSNCTINFGALMLINPNFTVENNFIATRKEELVSLNSYYGIKEGLAGNGDNLLDSEAAVHINDMVKAYEADYPGHTLETRSCFRSVGTNCGRLCAATGASDHHTGLTCDLIDPVYGTSLDTSTYNTHIDWQWLKENSYKYGFIDRFPEKWAGGPMSEPLNVDENGSTGLFETWHYRYVGIKNATEIATGKYNNGEYDSLEHYLKAQGFVSDLKNGKCD